MGAIALGGLAQGLAQGLKLGSDLQDAEERRSLLREQNERDKTRFGFEKEEMQDKSRRRALLSEAEKEYTEADSLFATGKILNPKEAAPKQGIAAPESAATTTPESGAAIKAPAAAPATPAAPVAAPAPRAAIAAPGAAPATPAAPEATDAQPAQPKVNPFRMDGEGKYQDMNAAWDRYYEMKGNALSKMLMAQGNYKEALQVPKMMRELRDSNWSEKVGASLAAMAGNAPGARDSFAKVYDNINDGWSLDPSKGKFDPEKGWIGLERFNKDGKRESFNMSPEQAAMVSMRYKDPGEVIKFMLERGDKSRSDKREDKKADAAMLSAQADMAYKGKVGAYYDRKGQEDADAAKQKASVEAVARMFPNANKEYKPEELMLEKDKGAAKLAQREKEKAMFDKTLDLAGLNPKVDTRVLGQIARQGKVEAQQDANGRAFTMVGNVKVYLQ
jgi:hypothetical protein